MASSQRRPTAATDAASAATLRAPAKDSARRGSWAAKQWPNEFLKGQGEKEKDEKPEISENTKMEHQVDVRVWEILKMRTFPYDSNLPISAHMHQVSQWPFAGLAAWCLPLFSLKGLGRDQTHLFSPKQMTSGFQNVWNDPSPSFFGRFAFHATSPSVKRSSSKPSAWSPNFSRMENASPRANRGLGQNIPFCGWHDPPKWTAF